MTTTSFFAPYVELPKKSRLGLISAMVDYDREADRYDATRGGDARATAAADAIETLLPPAAVRIADLGCGTGIVTVRMLGPGRIVIGVDRSAGMAARALARLPGRIVLGDVTRPPLASGSVDAVTMVWLLHLLSQADAAATLAAASTVLRPGGVLITTVGKNDAAYADTDDAGTLLRPVRDRLKRLSQSDHLDRVLEVGDRCGLRLAGRATFAGLGQGLSPRRWRERLLGGKLAWAASAEPGCVGSLSAALAALPDQDHVRPDPIYQLVALRKQP